MARDSALLHDGQGLRLLILEDSPGDARLMGELLRSDGLDVSLDVVDTRAGFLQALTDGSYDLILADYRLPGFNGHDALLIARQAAPRTPLIVVSGTIGEETAVDLLKQGAADCVLKDNLGRLPFAVLRALDAAREQAAHQRAGEELRSQAALLDLAHDAIIVCDAESRIVFWNHGAEETYGWTAQEAAGMPIHAFLQTLFPESLEAVEAQLYEFGQWDGELDHATKDGRRIIVASRWSLRRDATSESWAFLEINRDITERRAASRYARSLIEASLDPLVTISPDGTITDANQAIEQVTGLPRETLIGTDFSDYFTDPEAARASYQQVFKAGQVRDYPLAIRRGDGSVADVLYNASLYRDENDDVVGVFAAARDVTGLHRAQQAAAERAHFMEQLLEAIPVPVFYKDIAGRYIGCNEAFAALVNRSRDEVIGKTPIEVYPSDAAEQNAAADREVLAHKGRRLEYELQVPGADGEQLVVRTYKAAYSNVDGELAGVVGVDLDVTEVRRAEKELAIGAMRLRQTLKAAVAALGATTEMRDPYTAGHQRRVAALATAIATELSWDEGQIEALRTAALLHDIGKIVVPAEILSKPGRLTETEMLLIRLHADTGADTVADIDFEADVATMIRQHHERLDGSGYPAGLRGEEILPEARLLAVADTVEAMISHRPYRAALPIAEALAEIEGGAGVRYDAAAVRACVRLFREKGFELEG